MIFNNKCLVVFSHLEQCCGKVSLAYDHRTVVQLSAYVDLPKSLSPLNLTSPPCVRPWCALCSAWHLRATVVNVRSAAASVASVADLGNARARRQTLGPRATSRVRVAWYVYVCRLWRNRFDLCGIGLGPRRASILPGRVAGFFVRPCGELLKFGCFGIILLHSMLCTYCIYWITWLRVSINVFCLPRAIEAATISGWILNYR